MDQIIFLSGSTRGGTLEGIGRSLAPACEELGLHLKEISLLNVASFLETVKTIDFRTVKFVFSFVSMGMDVALKRADGSTFDLWQELGVPFLSIHGDSPAYFFDRHIVADSRFVSVYTFPEHRALRRRLPQVRGALETTWPIALDEISVDRLDFKKKRAGSLVFLKNGKDPLRLRKQWESCLEPGLRKAMLELAQHLESHLDDRASHQIDDLVMRYFIDQDYDVERLIKLRLFFIAQLDDYLRAVKSTRMAEALMDFPVEIRGNGWEHLDFSGKRLTYIDECDYEKSRLLIRDCLGLIDMSPNTSSHPHDRVMRAYGAHTLCLTNQQQFMEDMPHRNKLSFTFEKGSLQEQVAYLLLHRKEAIEMGRESAQAYKTIHPAAKTIQRLLEHAAFARFDNLRQRPPGSQDFFVWPQRLI